MVLACRAVVKNALVEATLVGLVVDSLDLLQVGVVSREDYRSYCRDRACRPPAANQGGDVAVEFDVGDGLAGAESVAVAGERVGGQSHVVEGAVVHVAGQ